MYFNKEQLILIWKAFASDNREYPSEEEALIADEIHDKAKKELYKRYGIICETA
ncbi:hypothetical protein [Paenibacillus sp. FJAT-26967]|uniref:hypothetical protein n=1 Tax=Paenibacillus sp. FJAT-26967 TaxID=1729690 RepID=UPI000A5BD0DE|nr:hypothetical protein [Paenibacillus sp. FJAT-26967]